MKKRDEDKESVEEFLPDKEEGNRGQDEDLPTKKKNNEK